MSFMHESLDRIFEDLFTSRYGELEVNMVQTQDGLIIKANLPGVKQENLDISVAGDILTISGEKKEDETLKNANYH